MNLVPLSLYIQERERERERETDREIERGGNRERVNKIKEGKQKNQGGTERKLKVYNVAYHVINNSKPI
jgi:hypothetical protein